MEFPRKPPPTPEDTSHTTQGSWHTYVRTNMTTQALRAQGDIFF